MFLNIILLAAYRKKEEEKKNCIVKVRLRQIKIMPPTKIREKKQKEKGNWLTPH